MFHVEQFTQPIQTTALMEFYSTNDTMLRVGLAEALFKGLPDDNGLFMPLHVPQLPTGFIQNLKEFSFTEIAFTVAKTFLQGSIPDKELQGIVNRAINFPAPLVALDDRTYILELTHGPSLAFKDFGARFMAEMMSYLNPDKQREIIILVATSGDTGGAVAAGFQNTPGIRVVILYPAGKVSALQEKQLTTLGGNISAIEIAGTFDDCQALVKQAFLDQDLSQTIRLSSANSINIARLIPQSFYYFEAYKQLPRTDGPVVFSVPSGNFGNLTAGILAKRMGLPVHQFIAATNLNKVVPEYLETGVYNPRTSVRTLSNAMDVGNPSNFVRMKNLYGSTWNNMRNEVVGFFFNDLETEKAMHEIDKKFNYTIDPHGAVGYLALQEYRKSTDPNVVGIILETAHPAKFLEDVQRILKKPIEIPARLKALKNRKKVATAMEPDFDRFKNWLIQHADHK